ncbi:glycosyltransferase family 1 protein [Annulohypoxylon maeteangense]|uniref:glycosyltransferase family 1 protein n=1 Tax=Annulohypoxylon maeteangense TaxID=1927788 RepID=UPI002008B7AF|nr:glycosyltransferase family 1 protein [Annulohypoxylon maeteangense]KAI0885588.1 glycosyltransferase family 1 protein [Annulohypoxylon maeteangense]
MPDLSAYDEEFRIYKCVLVTVGASASFKPLLEEVLSDAFIAKLKSLQFTNLIIQCGPDFNYFESAKPPRDPDDDPRKLNVIGFPYKQDLQRWFALAAPSTTRETAKRAKGVIITHAGSGSILDALDYNTTIIAVPNPALMGNHQSEIADEMEKQGFLTQGKLGSLADQLTEELLEAPAKQWPPDPEPDSAWPGGLWDVIDALMPRQTLDEAQKNAACVCM